MSFCFLSDTSGMFLHVVGEFFFGSVMFRLVFKVFTSLDTLPQLCFCFVESKTFFFLILLFYLFIFLSFCSSEASYHLVIFFTDMQDINKGLAFNEGMHVNRCFSCQRFRCSC